MVKDAILREPSRGLTQCFLKNPPDAVQFPIFLSECHTEFSYSRGRVAHRERLTSCNPCLCRCLEVATAPNHGLPSRALIETSKRYRLQHKIESFYPETAPQRRELYVKHMQCFAADATFAERCFMAANRVSVGKSEGVGAYEMSLHLTDKYPAWWKGRRFTRAISAWAAGKDAKTVRDILQLALLGPGRKRES